VPIPQNINFEVISHDKNRGFSEAKNTGIKKAIGKYITFIDADDMLTPESVEVRVKAFDDTVNFVHGNVYDVVNCSLSYCECVKNRKVFERSDGTKRYFTKEHKNKIHAQSMMFRKTVFDKFGLYWNINSKADKEMTYRLGLHPLSPLPALVKKKKINDFVAFYRRHPESMKSGLDKKEKQALKNRFDARIKQLQKEGITHDNTPFH
jgi:glycosyltransferase involved in cell wall biosynthesis